MKTARESAGDAGRATGSTCSPVDRVFLQIESLALIVNAHQRKKAARRRSDRSLR